MITCARAVAVLRGIEQNKLQAKADELEEILKRGLAVEADPVHLDLLYKVNAVTDEFPEHLEANPFSVEALRGALADIDEKLKSEWYRLRTADKRVAEQERNRVALRQVIGAVTDPTTGPALLKIMAEAKGLAPGVKYVACPGAGYELYAITVRGSHVARALELRIGRYAEVPLATFLKSHDKVEAKMSALSADVAALSQHVGYVKKHKTSVVVGLVKSGLPVSQALGAYQEGMRATNAADVAVTCARNVAAAGSTRAVSARLEAAFAALVATGMPRSPLVYGAAKSLLAFPAPESGVPRFVELFRGLTQMLGRVDLRYKFAARLIPAAGYPREILARVYAAGQLLASNPPHVRGARDEKASAVALAAMVKTQDALPAAVQRFRDVEAELFDSLGGRPGLDALALECVACPGSPEEVAATVRALCDRIAWDSPQGVDPVPIAAAFAKRFAY